MKIQCLLLDNRDFIIRRKFPFRKTILHKGKYDPLTGLIDVGKERYYREEKNDDPKLTPYFYVGGKLTFIIDVNKVITISGEEMKGITIAPKTRDELDSKLRNYLKHLTQSSFWDSMKFKKKDLVLLLLAIGFGAFLGSIIKGILEKGGIHI